MKSQGSVVLLILLLLPAFSSSLDTGVVDVEGNGEDVSPLALTPSSRSDVVKVPHKTSSGDNIDLDIPTYKGRHISPEELVQWQKNALEENKPLQSAITKSAVPTEPFFASSDKSLLDLKKKFGFSGTGIAIDPIVISGRQYTFNDTFVPFRMMNTRLYVKITGNVIVDNYHSAWYYEAGIWLYNVSNVIVENNVIQNNTEFGIRIESSSNVNVTGNSFLWNTMGAGLVSSSSFVNFENNTVRMNRAYGARSVSPAIYDADITVSKSYNVTIRKNQMEQSAADRYVYITNSHNIDIVQNNLVNSSYSGISGERIFVDSANANITILGNVISSNNGPGIGISGIFEFVGGATVIMNNTISKNLGSGIFLQNSLKNIVQKNTIFNNTGSGINTVTNISSSVILQNTINYNNGSGIFISGYSLMVENTQIQVDLNHIEGNNGEGVHLSLIDGVALYGNVIVNNLGNGILVDGSSNNTFFSDKILNNAKSGINIDLFTYWSDRSDDNSFTDVFLSGNGEHGFLSTSAGNRLYLSNVTSVDNNLDGIRFSFSGNNTVMHSTSSGNGGSGLYLMYSDNNYIYSFTADFNTNGIDMYSSYNTSIVYMKANSQIDAAIYAARADDLTVIGLSGKGNNEGLHLYEMTLVTLNSLNLESDEYDIYANNVNDTTVELSEFKSTFYNAYLLGQSTNVLFSDNSFFNGSYSIRTNKTENVRIINNQFLNTDAALEDYNSTYGTFRDNNVVSYDNGVYLEGSSSLMLENNTISASGTGVSIVDSEFVHTSANYIEGGNYGVHVDVRARNLTISDNTIVNSTLKGIFVDASTPPASLTSLILSNSISNSDVGIAFKGASNWLVGNNVVENNNDVGIHLVDSNSISLVDNLIYSNLNAGILLEGGQSFSNTISRNAILDHIYSYGLIINSSSSSNLISDNIFGGNGVLSTSQAFDLGASNVFSGNYWSDAIAFGNDSDKDGTLDEGYPINGVGNSDLSPLAKAPNYKYERHLLTVPAFVGFPPLSVALDGVVTVGWELSFDTFYHPITFTVFYSSDNGNTWSSLLTTSEPRADIDFGAMKEGNLNRLMVVADDKNGITSDWTSDTFTIKRGGGGVVTHTLSVPTVLTPSPGSTVSGTVTISWEISKDSAGHDVTYDVYYSGDSGTTWTLIDSTNGTSLSWDTTTVDDGKYLIKVVADDGNGLQSEDRTDSSFTVSNAATTSSTSTTTQTTTTQSATSSSKTKQTKSPLYMTLWLLPVLIIARRKLRSVNL